MDFDLPPDDDPRRPAVREWLDAHPDPAKSRRSMELFAKEVMPALR